VDGFVARRILAGSIGAASGLRHVAAAYDELQQAVTGQPRGRGITASEGKPLSPPEANGDVWP